MKGFEGRPIPIESDPRKERGAPKNPARRKFIGDMLKTGGALVAGGALYEASRYLGKKEGTSREESEKEKREMTPPVVITPHEQFTAYGEIKDLKKGIEAVENEHYFKLTGTGEGRRDMEIAFKNFFKHNVSKFAKPFQVRGLPKKLAYLIAFQETRAQNVTSWAGARGITGIMPATARAFGYEPKDVENPYIASEVTARYLETEKEDRFGNDIDLLLHAYNAGGGLFGYTQSAESKSERSAEGFYDYMQEYLNSRYKEVKEKGYYEYEVRGGDTIESIVERFEVPRRVILKKNDLSKESVLKEGQKLQIPYEEMEHFVKVVFRKPFEALHYVPEIKAKYRALKKQGYADLIETAMDAPYSGGDMVVTLRRGESKRKK